MVGTPSSSLPHACQLLWHLATTRITAAARVPTSVSLCIGLYRFDGNTTVHLTAGGTSMTVSLLATSSHAERGRVIGAACFSAVHCTRRDPEPLLVEIILFAVDQKEDHVWRRQSILCNVAWHQLCLQPVLLDVPDGSWLCPRCDYMRASPTLWCSYSSHSNVMVFILFAYPPALPSLRNRDLPADADAAQ